jgi:hypothetical protein
MYRCTNFFCQCVQKWIDHVQRIPAGEECVHLNVASASVSLHCKVTSFYTSTHVQKPAEGWGNKSCVIYIEYLLQYKYKLYKKHLGWHVLSFRHFVYHCWFVSCIKDASILTPEIRIKIAVSRAVSFLLIGGCAAVDGLLVPLYSSFWLTYKYSKHWPPLILVLDLNKVRILIIHIEVPPTFFSSKSFLHCPWNSRIFGLNSESVIHFNVSVYITDWCLETHEEPIINWRYISPQCLYV